MSIVLGNNPELFISEVDTGFTSENTSRIALNSGYSLKLNDITLSISNSKLTNTPNKTVKSFITGVSDVTISFSNDVIPLAVAPTFRIDSTDRRLWESLSNQDAISNPEKLALKFQNKETLHRSNFVFLNIEDVWYKISGVISQSVSLDLKFDSVLTTQWVLKGLKMEVFEEVCDFERITEYQYIEEVDRHCVAPKLTTLDIVSDLDGDRFKVNVTGMKLTIANNLRTVSRKRLGTWQAPELIYVKDRTVTGSFTAYLNTAPLKTRELLTDMLEHSYEERNRTYFLETFIGIGESRPYLEIEIPQAKLQIPNMSFGNTPTLQFNFSGEERIKGQMDEVRVAYKVLDNVFVTEGLDPCLLLVENGQAFAPE